MHRFERKPLKMYSPFLDYINYKEEYDNAIFKILINGNFIMGEEVFKLENQLENYVDAKHCIAVSSGTDALLMALMALDIGVDDEVITVPFTWISTAEVIALLGARPIFVDIDPTTFNMNPEKLKNAVTPRTKAIIPVSLYGQMAPLKEIQEIAGHIPVIEDGAQSFGAELDGKRSCSCQYSLIGCTSFFPSKPLGCYGDGGAIFTNDSTLALKMRSIRTHGGLVRFQHEHIGINGRLDTLQAGILLIKLNHFNESLELRKRNADIYNRELKGLDELVLPSVKDSYKHCYGQYTIRLPKEEIRTELIEFLKTNNIMTSIFYPITLHTQHAFDYLGYHIGDFPESENASKEVLSLPCYPELDEVEILYICNKVHEFFKMV